MIQRNDNINLECISGDYDNCLTGIFMYDNFIAWFSIALYSKELLKSANVYCDSISAILM